MRRSREPLSSALPGAGSCGGAALLARALELLAEAASFRFRAVVASSTSVLPRRSWPRGSLRATSEERVCLLSDVISVEAASEKGATFTARR
jgi:hypothetical protein